MYKLSTLFNKCIGFCTLLAFVLSQTLYADELITIDKFKGLARNPAPDKIEDGAHQRFTNVYLRDGNIHVVKGRDRLNSTAALDTVVNMLCYYENAAGTIQRLVVKESDEVVTYTTSGGSRTSIAGLLTNEAADCVQIGDDLYFTSATNGIYKWSGSGSATALGSVSTPSPVTFTASTNAGGMTSGIDIIASELAKTVIVDGTQTGHAYWEYNNSSTCIDPSVSTTLIGVDGTTTSATGVTSSSTVYLISAATTSTYSYRITSHNSRLGIESEASTTSTVTLTGANTFDVSCTDIFYTDSNGDAACATVSTTTCENQDFIINADTRQTSTSGTLAAAPANPFNEYCVYRSVAGGTEYFLVGCAEGATTFTDGKADTVLKDALDTTIDTISPPSFRYIAEYKGAIITGENNKLRFTHLPVGLETDLDTYWLETDEIETGTSKPITGLHTTTDSLLIFTSNRILELTGFGADSFRKKVIAEGIGTVSDETIETDNNGDIIFFAGTQGVYKLTVGEKPSDNLLGSILDIARNKVVKISSPNLDTVFRGDDSEIDLNPADYPSAHAYFDTDNDLYWLFISQHAFIFDNLNNSWSYIPATQMAASVYRKSPNAAGVGVLIDNSGFIFNNWTGYENGIESGTVTGNPTSSTATTLTDTGATFNTTGSGLTGLWVFNDNAAGEWRQISSNTATVLTVSSPWTTNPTSADTYYIAYIIPDILTKQYAPAQAPKRTEVMDFWLVNNTADTTQNLVIDSFEDKSTTRRSRFTVDLSSSIASNRNAFHTTTPLLGTWIQWRMRSFVYNTSNTISVPVNIISYSFKADAEDV